MRQSDLDEFSSDAVECPTCGESYDSEVALKAHHQWHDDSYWEAIIQNEYDESPLEFIQKRHHNLLKTIQEIADELGCSITAIQNMAERHGVSTRDLSEAKEVEWKKLDDEGRKARLDAPHEKTRELVEEGKHNFTDWADGTSLDERISRTAAARKAARDKYGDGGSLGYLWENRSDEMLEWVSENAALGTPAREENGMKGVSGQAHPRWRGGKNLYDAVKKCIRRESWNETRERAREEAGRECEMCGESQSNRGLDVHHIVPLMCGGTNRDGNLMALCQSCHRIVEAHTRELFDSVLVE